MTRFPSAGLTGLATVAMLLALAGPAAAQVEDYADYAPQQYCSPRAKPGTESLGRWLVRRGGGCGPISRPCSSGGTSEHKEGRAFDWILDATKSTERRIAEAFLEEAFATDPAGNEHAKARRMGIMYIIWDDHIYSASGQFEAEGYLSSSCKSRHTCSRTLRHRDHMHISLSWPGALGTTSFWTQEVAAPNYGPCRARDLNWAAPYRTARITPCLRYPKVLPPEGASANLRTLTTFSGMRVSTGSAGRVVTAVQTALRITRTGRYDAATKVAVKKFQTRHGLHDSGNVNSATWRALLKDQAPTA